MSHFTTIRTRITDQDALVAALADLGYRKVELHDPPRSLRGFLGDQREQRAHLVIPRKQVGRLSNDIGFERQHDGTFRVWISDYDRHKHNERWLERVAARHAYHVTAKTLVAQGYSLASEQRDRDGTVRMVLRRVA